MSALNDNLQTSKNLTTASFTLTGSLGVDLVEIESYAPIKI